MECLKALCSINYGKAILPSDDIFVQMSNNVVHGPFFKLVFSFGRKSET